MVSLKDLFNQAMKKSDIPSQIMESVSEISKVGSAKHGGRHSCDLEYAETLETAPGEDLLAMPETSKPSMSEAGISESTPWEVVAHKISKKRHSTTRVVTTTTATSSGCFYG